MASVIEFGLSGESSAICGGVIGASKASTAFQELADAVGAAATQAGIFLADRTVA